MKKSLILAIAAAILVMTTTSIAIAKEGSAEKPLTEQLKDASEDAAKDVVVKAIRELSDAAGRAADNIGEKGVAVIEKLEPVAITMVKETGMLYFIKGATWIALALFIIITLVLFARSTIYNQEYTADWANGNATVGRIIITVTIILLLFISILRAGSHFAKAGSPTRQLLIEVVEASQKTKTASSNSNQ